MGVVSLLTVDDLTVSFPTADGLVEAVRGVSFQVNPGETLGIVGESGSGKSVSMLTLMGLNPGATISGKVLFDGQSLTEMSPREMRKVRGAQIGMIFQDPLSSLHPHYRVGWQIVEAIRAHTKVSRKTARAKALDLLKQVGIPQPDKRIDSYPHELSGGMRQRVMIAMALSLRPRLLIADEPTTALDATVQAQILDLIRHLQKELGMSLIMITHDLGVIAEITDRVAVMYAGRHVEAADRDTLYYRPHHPYTVGLLKSIPASVDPEDRLVPIVGQPPSMIALPEGCAFARRCPYAMERCLTDDPIQQDIAGPTSHRSACWLPPDLVGVGNEVDSRRQAYAEQHRGERSAALPGVTAAAAGAI
jgi:oligopeptide/dipeptide ABC transporter ATP-binding protein